MTDRVLSLRHRYVYEHDGIVTKLGCPSDIMSGAQNAHELDTWFRVRNLREARFYAPVLAYREDCSMLSMPYCGRFSVPSQQRLRDFEKELTDHGIMVYDLTHENVGYWNGQLVLLDYGHTRIAQGMRDELGRKFCGACNYCVKTHRTSQEIE